MPKDFAAEADTSPIKSGSKKSVIGKPVEIVKGKQTHF
jgi:hypothetical protein